MPWRTGHWVDAGPAGEPLAAVLELSSESGVPEVGAAGEGAFGESLATVSLVGGVTLLAVPVVACLQVPRSLDLTRQRH
ncbi:hypothetical protein [Actinoalloteichus sp. AHMU CJ021]|uniref:hypothetical protein n=1 Tax=Actinoalloteichus sp. AHMU CJ021 TaxID=2072503 RepID=UPI002686CF01